MSALLSLLKSHAEISLVSQSSIYHQRQTIRENLKTSSKQPVAFDLWICNNCPAETKIYRQWTPAWNPSAFPSLPFKDSSKCCLDSLASREVSKSMRSLKRNYWSYTLPFAWHTGVRVRWSQCRLYKHRFQSEENPGKATRMKFKIQM